MRLAEKDFIIGILDTLYEAVAYIEQVGIDNGKNILHDCVEGLQAVGRKLKEDLKAAESLKQYDILEVQFLMLLTSNIKQLKQEILKFKDIVKSEVKCKIKILFLPYKASMWTSLESIWKAAQQDIQCETVVMPIPYFELDYKKQEVIPKYEGEDYPEYVPIVHYEHYNIEEEYPDIVFIHNPYDDRNTITSVKPKYYSRNLKPYTSMLVYVPYFIMGPVNSQTDIPNHMNLPVIEHVDKFIVQSERVKELYEKYNKDKNIFIALGSPKADAIIENMKETMGIPDEWKSKTEGKKVFLYNVHLSTIPKLKDVAIRKIKFAITEITSRENCVLLWRAHPLIEIMINNYAPEYLQEYRKIKNSLKELDNVIIDENGSYLPAFAISDAMISTHSSLIREYMLTEKPILIVGKKIDKKTFENSPININCNYFSVGENNESRFSDFIDMVIQEKDPKKLDRVDTIKRSLINCDGTCGMRVFEYIKKETLERE